MNSDIVKTLEDAIEQLTVRSVKFERGLSNAEISELETRFRFKFPEDLRAFLQLVLPIGERFPNWRDPNPEISSLVSWPEEGICFDVRNRVFWWPTWGVRPVLDDDAVTIARSFIRAAPRMIPIFGHCYISSVPHEAGNPVFSIHQADIIHIGANLAEYLLRIRHTDSDEQIEKRYPIFGEHYRYIQFWTDLAFANTRA